MTVPCKSLLNSDFDILALWLQGSWNWRGSAVVFLWCTAFFAFMYTDKTEVFYCVSCSFCVCVLVAKAIRGIFIQGFYPLTHHSVCWSPQQLSFYLPWILQTCWHAGRNTNITNNTLKLPRALSSLLYSLVLWTIWEFVWASVKFLNFLNLLSGQSNI